MNMAGLLNFLTTGSNGITVSGSADTSGFNTVLQQVANIGQTILVVIYVVLGVFLIIKGAILGMQIVKAADEPQVRQEKIGALKWLVIGVAIGYGVAGIANILIGVIANMTTVNGTSGGGANNG